MDDSTPMGMDVSTEKNPLTGIDAPKARGTCNGGPRYVKAVTLAKIYAACVEQPIH